VMGKALAGLRWLHRFHGWFQKGSGVLVVEQQRPDFAPQRLVIGAVLFQKRRAPVRLQRQRRMVQLLNLPPSLRFHAPSPCSTHASAVPSPGSSPASRFVVRYPLPRRFLPRSGSRSWHVPPHVTACDAPDLIVDLEY